MQPFSVVGLTIPVAAGTAVAAAGPGTSAYPQPNAESSVVLVSNMTVPGSGAWGYFSTMDSEPDDTDWPPVITDPNTPQATITNPIPTSGLGVPIAPGTQVLVAIAPSVTYYAAQGQELLVTPVELLKTQ